MKLRGSATIEMAYIVPVILLAITAAVYLGFFFHDKSVLQGLVYEGAMIGSSGYRMDGEVEVTTIETFIKEKAEVKLLYFPAPEVEVEVSEGVIQIEAVTESKGMEIVVSKMLVITEPEEQIRGKLILGDQVGNILGIED